MKPGHAHRVKYGKCFAVCPHKKKKSHTMTLTYIWTGFFLAGFLAALAQWLFLGDVEVFKRIIDGTFAAAKLAVMISRCRWPAS